MPPSLRAALYLRVSGDTQETANQVPSILAFCERQGWEVVHVYEETTSAWRNGHQIQLRRAYADGRRGKFDVLVVWALDRLSREGIAVLLGIVNRFAAVGVQVVSVQEPWTQQSGPMLELLLAISAWAAKFESQRKSERVKEGMERARQEGKRVGRPKGAKDRRKRRPKRVRSLSHMEGVM